MHTPPEEQSATTTDSGNGGDITAQLEAIQISESSGSVGTNQGSRPGPSSSSGVASSGAASSDAEPSGQQSSSSSVVTARRVVAEGSNVPIPKADLPYQLQTFIRRPERKVESTSIVPKFKVKANFYKVLLTNDIPVEQYNIEIKMKTRSGWSVENKRERVQPLFWLIFEQNRTCFPDEHKMIYNDNNLLYLQSGSKMYNSNRRPDADFKLLATRPPKKAGPPRRDRSGRLPPPPQPDIEMRVTYTGRVVIRATPERVQEKNEMTTFIDLLLTMRLRCPTSEASRFFVPHGHSLFFAPDNEGGNPFYVDLGDGNQALCGIHSAVKVDCEDGTLLNVDLSNGIFTRPKMPLVQYICERWERRVMNADRLAELKHRMAQQGANNFLADKEVAYKVRKLLTGVTVYTTYSGATKKFKIGGFTGSARTQMFEAHNGHRMSVAEFFRDQYNMRLEYPDLPCIFVEKKKHVCIPIEVCFTEPKAARVKEISTAMRGFFIRQVGRPPIERNEILERLCNPEQGAGYPEHLAKQDSWMAQFGVELDKTQLEVTASLLPAPRLVYGGGETFKDDQNLGEWNLCGDDRRLRMANQANIILAPALLHIGQEYCRESYRFSTQPFNHLMGVLETYGVKVMQKEPMRTATWCSRNKGHQLEWGLNKLKNELLAGCRDANGVVPDNVVPLIICVFPMKCAGKEFGHHQNAAGFFNEYAMLKLLADCKVNVHCQGLLKKTYDNLSGTVDASTANNVALKIMGKIGVTVYKLDKNIDDPSNHKAWAKLVSEPTLILGIDVTHPGVAERKEAESTNTKAPSVACVIGNIDLEISKFEASYRVQLPGEEMIVNMRAEFRERIMSFFHHAKIAPRHIIVYRDGVSESMFQKTLHEEKAALLDVFKELDKNYKPTLTYIVMTKRHHARFTPMDNQNRQAPMGNLRPGTLIESGVTSKTFFDFFLYSHHGAMGTSRPNHYYVLYNDWEDSSPFQFQHITFALAYNYIRCTKSVSQPAPVMYAHLGAQRAKYYLEAEKELCEERIEKAQVDYQQRNGRRMLDQEVARFRESQMNTLTSLKVATSLKGMIFV